MGRRRQSDEIAFGSDSFLDIVANIVGILIILIVVAGVRVSQMPVASSAREAAPSTGDVPPVLSVAVSPASGGEESTPVTQKAAPPELPAPPPPPLAVRVPEPIRAPPELLARKDILNQQLVDLRNQCGMLSARLDARAREDNAGQAQVRAARAANDSQQQQIDNGRRTIGTLQSELETKQRQIAGLQLELAEIEAARPAAQPLRHKLTPVGKVVRGPELHFLLSENKVTVVPVDELAEELKEELLRKKSQLLRGRTRVGTVGPLQGFTMEYVVAREAISMREELQMGTAVIRLGISEWRMHPQPGAVFEAADEALLPRSRFLSALRSAGVDATLTFWVYPDSFALHRELQVFAHDNGFDVAARPLPFGIPITGSSTNGSRSIAQ